MDSGVVALDTCVWSNLAKYRDVAINGEKSIYYGKIDQSFIDEYENLYNKLKRARKVVVPLVGQIEIASSYTMFLPIMRVINELNCKLEPFPSLTLMGQMARFVKSKKIKSLNLSPTQLLLLSKNYDQEKHKQLMNESKFMKPMLEKYYKEFERVDAQEVYYYQNVASILSLIYRSENDNRNRMIAVKDMFDAIMLAECQIHGVNHFFTNNIKDFKKSINYSLGEIDNNIIEFFKDNLLKTLYVNYCENNEIIDQKNMLKFFKDKVKEEYDDFDLLLLSNVASIIGEKESDENYKKFLNTLSRTIYTQRYELKVSIMKRDKDFLDFLKELNYLNCEDKISELWNNTINKTNMQKNSTLVQAIYDAQGIHEKNDDADKTKAREERIKQLFDVNSKEELIQSLTESILRYKNDVCKKRNHVKINFVGIK